MLRKFGRPSKLAALLLVFTLVFMAGCQAISNVDFNKTLTNALKVTSSEGKQSVELKLELDEEALEGSSEEEIALIKLVSHMKLTLDNVKTQDNEHLSLDGSLAFGDTASIGFSLKMSDTLAVMELEGAKQPFVLDLTSESLLGLTGMSAEETAASSPELDNDSLTALSHQLIDTAGSYIINNLPNPERIDVKPVNELINGTSTSLMHVHIDMNGPEIWAWVKNYVDALVKDRAGLDQMIAGVFEILANDPEVWKAIGADNPVEDNTLDGPTLEETVEEAADEAAAMLVQWQEQLRLMEEEDQETLDQIFTENLAVKADVYIDNKLDIRKQVYELSFAPDEALEADMMPFKGLTVKVESEAWNVNGDVKAEAPEASEEAWNVVELSDMQGYQILKQFEEKSFMYDLLKNKLHIGKQSISWYPYEYYNPVIVTATHRTIIPLRDTVEKLGAELTYDAKTKSMKVYDEATGTTIGLKAESDSAVVNGKSVKWSFPVTVIDGTTYVPARDLAQALGAKITWTVIYEDEKVFTLEREV